MGLGAASSYRHPRSPGSKSCTTPHVTPMITFVSWVTAATGFALHICTLPSCSLRTKQPIPGRGPAYISFFPAIAGLIRSSAKGVALEERSQPGDRTPR